MPEQYKLPRQERILIKRKVKYIYWLMTNFVIASRLSGLVTRRI
jgi:hypothetical protein